MEIEQLGNRVVKILTDNDAEAEVVGLFALYLEERMKNKTLPPCRREWSRSQDLVLYLDGEREKRVIDSVFEK